MATAIRRLDGDRIEVMFSKALDPEGKASQALNQLSQETNLVTIKDREGAVIGVECTEKEYVRFLQAIDSPRTTIESFRRAMDDSKKAVRERQRR